ncbi:MAG: HD domain-containing protein [Patescibacteria group bacterium]
MTLKNNQHNEELNTKNNKIIYAFNYALEKHKNQFRKSGEPYIEHCIQVYKILKSWGVENQELLIAALLHDVVEDTPTTIDQVKKIFGDTVSFIVEGVTYLNIKKHKDTDFKALQKVMGASHIDPKVSILKLADRYHNLSTLQFMPRDKRWAKAHESIEVYAKLAESLGLWVIKTEIEDLSFEYLNFEGYTKVKNTIDNDKRLSEEEITKNTNILKKIMKETRIKGKVAVKKSGYYHAYQKLKYYSVKGLSSNEDFKKINDVISYRVIVKSQEDCYKMIYGTHKALGKLIDYERYDEFIGSNKRDNGYEALQTTLETTFGSVEIAVVTESMENFNNWGYVCNLRKKIESPIYNLKLLFTPENDLIFLPENARAVDFAYEVNTRLGDNSTEVLVNGRPKSLDCKIKNTDLIKVVTGERSLKEDVDLLKVCLPSTRIHLQRKIIEREKLSFIKQGKEILEGHLAPRGILDLADIGEDLNEIIYALGCENIEEIYYRTSKGYLRVDRLDSLLNDHNITKSGLGWTTIQTWGSDKPKLLRKITDVLSKFGGNIIRITLKKDYDNFYLRIVAENINPKDILRVEKELKKEPSFIDLKIV